MHADYADAATKEKYAGICNSIAGGLPDITKGALTAANAFRRGDSINGTAAIMDICAAVAPIIGSLFTAGGPPGALFGRRTTAELLRSTAAVPQGGNREDAPRP